MKAFWTSISRYLLFTLLLMQLHQPFLASAQGETEGEQQALDDLSLQVGILAKDRLMRLVDETLSKRLTKSDFSIRVVVEPNGDELSRVIARWGRENQGLFMSNLRKRDYQRIRALLSSAQVNITYSNAIASAQWAPIEAELTSTLERADGDLFEEIIAEPAPLQPGLSERMIQQAAAEEMKRLEREFELKTQLESAKSEIRGQELRREYELKAQLNDQKLQEAKSELENERRKRFELADLFAEDFSINEYIAKTFPVLARFAAVGGGLGVFILIGLMALGFLLIAAAGTLGRTLKRGMTEFSLLMKGDGGRESVQQSEKDEKKEEEEDLGPDAAIDFEHKPQLKEAADKLREQVIRDPKTTAVVLSAVAEEGNFGEVIAIFDILGPELARTVFQFTTSSAKKGLQRAFYRADIKRPHPSSLFNRINELRAMLATTDVMMTSDSEKEFSQVVLAYPDEEIASALAKLDVVDSVALLSRLPAEKMLSIARKLPSELSENVRVSLAKVVRNGVEVSQKCIKDFTDSFTNEVKLRLEETKKYLQGVLEIATEEESEGIIEGLRFDPRLALEVIGIRATIDDLWAQESETIDGLFALLELELAVAVLYAAPDQVREKVISGYPDRKKQLSADFLDNLSRDSAYRESMADKVKDARKLLLAKLTKMAKSGVIQLPSYEHMKREAERQSELEKEGKSYEEHMLKEAAA